MAANRAFETRNANRWDTWLIFRSMLAAVLAQPLGLLSSVALDHIRRFHLAVVPSFISPALVDALIDDVDCLLSASQPSAMALEPPSASNGAVQWFELLPNAPPQPSAPQQALYQLVDGLIESLEQLDQIELDRACTVRVSARTRTCAHTRVTSRDAQPRSDGPLPRRLLASFHARLP